MRVDITTFLFSKRKQGSRSLGSRIQKSRKWGAWIGPLAFAWILGGAFSPVFARTETTEDSWLTSESITIDENPTSTSSPADPTDMSPLSSLPPVLKNANTLMLSLLNWILHTDSSNLPFEKYNRTHHFGRWINDPEDDTCFNTRAKVLIRDSEIPVSFKEKNHCVVDRGDWAEPYVGTEITSSGEIQIDHMVPLKNAYISGAWKWDYQARCLYANFMGNRFHLLSVNGRENMRKGDKAPDRYLPPNINYRCEYLENWLKIKLIWRLSMTRSEVEAIHHILEEHECDPRNFVFSFSDLADQRRLIQELHQEVCPAQ